MTSFSSIIIFGFSSFTFFGFFGFFTFGSFGSFTFFGFRNFFSSICKGKRRYLPFLNSLNKSRHYLIGSHPQSFLFVFHELVELFEIQTFQHFECP